MFAVSSHNTMRNARPKSKQDDGTVTRTIQQIREERRRQHEITPEVIAQRKAAANDLIARGREASRAIKQAERETLRYCEPNMPVGTKTAAADLVERWQGWNFLTLDGVKAAVSGGYAANDWHDRRWYQKAANLR